MANLEPRADKAVREAVDAFMDGRLVPQFTGEVVFETANSRYRLLDGTVFAAPDASLIGAELVGWLSETTRRCLIEWSWQPGSRAVLVDRKRDRNIIVTSTTRLLHQEEQAPPSFPRESEALEHEETREEETEEDPWPAQPSPEFSARHAAIIASTPPPGPALAPFASGARVVVPAPASSASRRAGAVHAPPRPIAPRAAAMPPPQARPLPAPALPPAARLPGPAGFHIRPRRARPDHANEPHGGGPPPAFR
jgi:hypothetical protein